MSASCWRCENSTPDFEFCHDPMMPHWDRIGICGRCANERHEVMDRYIKQGRQLAILRPVGDGLTA